METSRYAIVVVIEAGQADEAWEKASRSFGSPPKEVSYVGAPWNVPAVGDEPVEFGTDSICLTLNGKCVALEPAD